MKTIGTALIVSLILLTSPGAAAGEPDRSWHLLTVSEGGNVSLLRDLTRAECEFAMHRAKGEPATSEEVAAEKSFEQAIRQDAWLMCHEHPTETYVGDEWGTQASCDKGRVMTYTYSRRTFGLSSGNIKSAECFQ